MEVLLLILKVINWKLKHVVHRKELDTMNEIKYTEKVFEDIKHIDENGIEINFIPIERYDNLIIQEFLLCLQ